MPDIVVPQIVHAFAVAGDTCTPYIAAGRGPVVVVLTDSQRRASALVAGLSGNARVVAPAPWESAGWSKPAAGDTAAFSLAAILRDLPGWMQSFLDALGLDGVFLVVDATFAADALRFVLLSPDRIRGLAVLQHAHSARGGEAVSGRLQAGAPICAIWSAGRDSGEFARDITSLASFIKDPDSIGRD